MSLHIFISVELVGRASMSGGDGLTWRVIVTLVCEMRDHCRVDFIGLTRTGLVDADFDELATALENC